MSVVVVIVIWSRCVFSSVMFFFFKQKTAYEVRISDWSSDVCSSDLRRAPAFAEVEHVLRRREGLLGPDGFLIGIPAGVAEAASFCSLPCEGRGGLGRGDRRSVV